MAFNPWPLARRARARLHRESEQPRGDPALPCLQFRSAMISADERSTTDRVSWIAACGSALAMTFFEPKAYSFRYAYGFGAALSPVRATQGPEPVEGEVGLYPAFDSDQQS